MLLARDCVENGRGVGQAFSREKAPDTPPRVVTNLRRALKRPR